MQTTKTKSLKTIVRNLITLYTSGRYEDQSTYQAALNNSLNRRDLAAVKQGFQRRVNSRKIRATAS